MNVAHFLIHEACYLIQQAFYVIHEAMYRTQQIIINAKGPLARKVKMFLFVAY